MRLDFAGRRKIHIAMIRTSSFLCAALIVLPLVAAETRGPNVLFIAIDDLRPQLGCYGEEPVITPHLDKLAAQGRLFHNHYTQVPTCGASRYSMLTGSYPRRPAAFDNGAFKLVPKRKPAEPYSLPGLFLKNGYATVSLGKISHSPSGTHGPVKGEAGHDGAAANVELPFSWTRVWGPMGEWGSSENAFFAYADGKTRIRGKTPAVEAADVPDHGYPDALIADQAIQELQKLKDGPFFLAVGFYKPHLPFTAPKRYWDLYEPEKIPLAPNPLATPGLEINRKTGGEMFGAYTIAGKKRSSVEEPEARLLRHGYYAAVSYVDAQVGRVLAELDRLDLARNTIVVVWGDHGWHLGDAGAWGKHTLHERALRSALIIRTPDTAEPGVPTRRIVESIDLMPTLAEACGLTPPAGLDGKSLLPLLRDPAADWDHPARWFWGKGEAVRTDPWCLKEWTGQGGKVLRTELFDHRNDPDELRNVAKDHPEVVDELRKQLLRHAAP
jgi:arylsulfatase A-like enzyme